MNLSRYLLCWLSALAMHSGAALAEPFPTKPVKIVVPFPISGPTDIRGTSRMTRTYRMVAQNAPPAISDTLARIAAEAIRVDSGHPVALERQPGAITTRGASYVAKAPADGHTLLLASNATMVINPHFFHGANYDPVRELQLIAPLATMPFVLLAQSSLPVESPQALIAWLRPRPGEINYGSSGDGSTGHLAGELFRRMARVSIVHVSYNGGVAALNGLSTRQVSLVFAAQPLALAFIPSDYFRPLAITSLKRSERLPGLPTLAESGIPDFELEAWYGVFAPAGNPPVANAWLRERIGSAFAEPATRMQLVALGLEPVAMPIEKFATRINTEYEKWAPVLRASRLPLKDGA
jgi:tripartite-type tricarboxylate transporter receptor subunit TctC